MQNEIEAFLEYLALEKNLSSIPYNPMPEILKISKIFYTQIYTHLDLQNLRNIHEKHHPRG